MRSFAFPQVLIMSTALLSLAGCASARPSGRPESGRLVPTRSAPGWPHAARRTPIQPERPVTPARTYGDGTYLVGKDIPPGTYATTVPSDSKSCFWERDRTLDPNRTDMIIDSDSLDAGAQGLVVIAPTDEAFGTIGCGQWRLATGPASPATRIGEGTYRVGVDIVPGRYATTVPDDSLGCYWERTRTLDGGDPHATIAKRDELPPGTRVTVAIAPTDKLFKTSGCGTFTRR